MRGKQCAVKSNSSQASLQITQYVGWTQGVGSAFGHTQITPAGRQLGWVRGKLPKLRRVATSLETATDEAEFDVLKEPLRIPSNPRVQSVYVYGFVVSLFRFRVRYLVVSHFNPRLPSPQSGLSWGLPHPCQD